MGAVEELAESGQHRLDHLEDREERGHEAEYRRDHEAEEQQGE